jgi:protein-S-isoprenylcysteine O-methyltransferase Ste14
MRASRWLVAASVLAVASCTLGCLTIIHSASWFRPVVRVSGNHTVQHWLVGALGLLLVAAGLATALVTLKALLDGLLARPDHTEADT